jgi:CRISPR-associated protein Csb2
MVAIVVHLVRCAFEASESDQVTVEWPPHPARLFGALVDAADLDDAGERRVLVALEEAPPPLIHTPEVWRTSSPRQNFVVTNEVKNESKYGTIHGRVATGTRTWPRITLSAPEVIFEWPSVEFSNESLSALDRMTGRVAYFGRSTSPSVVAVHVDPQLELRRIATTWSPLSTGIDTPLRGLRPGYLALLERAFHEGMSAHEVPTVEIEYTDKFQEVEEPAFIGQYESTMAIKAVDIVIDGRRSPEIITLVRRAFLANLSKYLVEDQQPAALCGHPNLGEETWVQVSFLALLHVGHERADGTIKGIAMALPVGLERRYRTVALAAWQDITHLTLGLRGTAQLREPIAKPLVAQQSSRWVRNSKTWVSSTPIVPSRYCTTDTQRRAFVVEACHEAGLPVPEVEVSREPFVAGGLRLPVSRVARRPGEFTRPNFHARIRFDSPVTGPIFLGDMCH